MFRSRRALSVVTPVVLVVCTSAQSPLSGARAAQVAEDVSATAPSPATERAEDLKSPMLPVLLALTSASPDDAPRLLNELLVMMDDRDPLVRIATAGAIGRLGLAAGTQGTASLARVLCSQAGDGEVEAVVNALQQIGVGAVSLAAYQVSDGVDEKSPLGARIARLDILVRLAPLLPNGSDSYWLIKRLLGMAIRDQSPDRGAYADALIERLPAFGTRVAPAIAEMLSDARSTPAAGRRWLFSILPRLGPEVGASAVAALRKVAGGQEEPLWAEASIELVALGADDANVRSRLLNLAATNDPDFSLADRERAFDALVTRRPDPQIIRELVDHLPDDATGDTARELLSRYGTAAAPALPLTIDRLPRATSIAAERRMLALIGSFGPAARDAVPLIAPMVKGGYQSLRLAAMNALAEIGPDAKSAVPQLLPLLRESSPVIRGSAAYALVRIAPEDQRLPGELVRAAKENDWMLCVVLSRALRATRGVEDVRTDLATLARRGPNVEIRAIAYYALRDLGVAVSWLYAERSAAD